MDPLGVRNNNPGNLEASSWTQSQPGYVSSDGRFGQFATPEDGFNALNALLTKKYQGGATTPRQIISTWAPASDGNNVGAYATTIGKAAGIGPDDPIRPEQLPAIGHAIAQYESPGFRLGGGGALSTNNTSPPAPQGGSMPDPNQGALASPSVYGGQGALSQGPSLGDTLQGVGAWLMTPNNPQAGASMLANVNQKRLQQQEMALRLQLGMKPEFLEGGTNPFTGQKNYLVGNPADGTIRAAGALNQYNGIGGGSPGAGSPGATDPNNPLGPFYDAVQRGVTGDDLRQYVPKEIGPMVDGFIKGTMAPPSGAALKDPKIIAAMNAAGSMGYDMSNYKQRYQTAGDWATGGKSGQSFQALSAADEHMSQLLDKAQALNNTWLTPWNAFKNYVEDKVGDPRPSQFEASKKAVLSEVVKAYQGGHLTDTQMSEFSAGLKNSASPDQLINNMNSFHDLMTARQNVMAREYHDVMGKDQPYQTSNKYGERLAYYAQGGQPPAPMTLSKAKGAAAPTAQGTAPAAAPTAPQGAPQVGETRVNKYGVKGTWTGNGWALEAGMGPH